MLMHVDSLAVHLQENIFIQEVGGLVDSCWQNRSVSRSSATNQSHQRIEVLQLISVISEVQKGKTLLKTL